MKSSTALPNIQILLLIFLTIGGLTSGAADKGAPAKEAAAGAGLEGLMVPGALLGDTSGDGVADYIRARLVVPADGSGLLAAAAVCERLGFESAGLDFDLVIPESRFQPQPDQLPIVIGGTNRWLPEEVKAAVPACVRSLPSWAGLVPGSLDGRAALFLFGSDPAAEAFAARSFFGRWPYLWEIWGRESGLTQDRLLADLTAFFKGRGLAVAAPTITAVYYENKGRFDRLKQDARDLGREMKGWRMDAGEITCLCAAVKLAPADLGRAAAACRDLLQQRKQGIGTEVLNYPGVALLDVRLTAGGQAEQAEIPRFSEAIRFLNRRFQPEEAPKLARPAWLDNLYSAEGLLADGNADRIPDDVPFQVSVAEGDLSPALCHFAARVALETSGARFPLVRLDRELPPLLQAGPLVVVGNQGMAAGELRDLGVDLSPPQPGLGVIRALNQKPLPVPEIYVGSDLSAATDHALAYLARYYPYLNPDRDEERSLGALLEAVQRWLAGREPAAALAALVGEKAPLLRMLAANPDIQVKGTAFLDRPAADWEAHTGTLLADRLLPGAEIQVRARQEPKEGFTIRKELPWEWDLVRESLQAYLTAHPDEPDRLLDVRLSEPAAVRARIAGEIRAMAGTGGAGSRIRVLSAYKQGFSWLAEDVSPRLKGRDVARIRIDFQSRPSDAGAVQKVYEEPVRWLEELYPIDEILARDLGIRPNAVEFFQTEAVPSRPVYRITAWDRDGRELLTEDFTPLYEERPFFQRFPSWGSAPVPLAGFTAVQHGREVVRRTADTDLARVWQVYQTEVLPELEKHVMKLTGNHPTPDKQPFFARLTADVTASEPDEPLGFQREHVSSLEAFHEDFYFLTLEYLNQLLDKSQAADTESVHYVRANPYGTPGTIVPFVHQGSYGKGPVVEFRLDDFQSEVPELDLAWTTPEGIEHPEKVKLGKFEPAGVHCEAMYVRQTDSLWGARLRVDLKKDEDYERFCRFFQAFRDLTEAGMDSPLAGFGLARLEFDVRSPATQGLFTLDFPNGDEAAERRNGETRTHHRGTKDTEGTEAQRTSQAEHRTSNIEHQTSNAEPKSEIRRPNSANPQSAIRNPTSDVHIPHPPTDRIICPDECSQLMLQFQNLPGYHVFRAGTSYEGRPVYAAEILAPSKSELLSRTKLLLRKPSLMLTGRQHANEVSSTTYILKLMELLAGDPAWQPYRDKINFVLQPMENPDGAALACRLQEQNPDHSLHAGRFTALGVDVGYEIDRPDTLLTEALVRNRLYARWLPDIYLNLHGYPSHEWVQQFSGYTPYLFRQYWIPKGWFAYFRYDDSGLSPEYEQAGRRLMDYIRRGLEGVPDIASFDRDFYARYRRWAVRWQPHIHYLDEVGETTLFHTRRSGTATRPSPRLQTTFAEGIPEQMDETERGDFLAFLSRQGLAYVRAHLDYLAQAPVQLVPVEEDKPDYTFFQLFRRRPPQAPEPALDRTGKQGRDKRDKRGGDRKNR